MLSENIYYAPASGQVKKAVIMLHGYGSDGNDLISMAPQMALPDTIFYAPNAPNAMPQTAGYKWFDLMDEAANTVYEQSSYVEKLMQNAKVALPDVLDFISHIAQKHQLELNQIFIMGFSQGGLLALMSALIMPQKLAGAIGASAVPLMINSALSLSEVKSKPDVLLTHGTDDDVVPFIGMQETLNTLKNIGCNVQTHIVDGMGHGIDMSSERAMQSFIAAR